MARNLFFILLLFVVVAQSKAQNIQWASKLIDFSTQLSPYEYSASQVLGKPNVLPEAGDNPNAWLPNTPDKIDFVKVGFDNPTKIQQIAIAESYNPSAVYKVFAYDSSGNEYLINTFDSNPIELQGRLLNIYLDETPYFVTAVKVELNGAAVPGYNGIDAIGISNSKEPMEIEVKVKENVSLGIKTEKLNEQVNSNYQELRPLISPDGKTLYFSRRFHPQNVGGTDDEEDIWYSQKGEDGSWQRAKNLGAPLNNDGPNYISSITADGQSIVVILGNEYKKDNMKPGVSIARKTSTGWTEPKTLDIKNAYIEGKDGFYFLSNNRKVLIMSIERFDTHGGKDLYVSFQLEHDKWSEPQNLGNDINTAHDETSPFLAADDETLYFSSGGYSGYGGSDIYISRRLDETYTNWTTPENLGSDINSDQDDVFFNIPPSGKFAYFSKGSLSGKDADIYQIQLPIFYQPSPVVTLKGKIIDDITKNPVEATIQFKLMPENTDVGSVIADGQDGTYQITLPSGASYYYIAKSPGYSHTDGSIDVSSQSNEVTMEINLSPEDNLVSKNEDDNENAQIESPISEEVLDTKIYFGFSNDDTRDKYEDELKNIARFMKQNNDVILEINGYTDNVGSKDFNLKLSERRARAVYQMLKEFGVDYNRMVVVAYGEARPVASNETEEGRQKNRRVTFNLAEGSESRNNK